MFRITQKHGLLIAAALITGSALWAGMESSAGTGHDNDLIEIEKVVGYYLNSGRTGDVDLLRKAFHPSLRLQFVKDGEYGEWSGAEYIGWRKPGKKSSYRTKILSIDRSGDAALVKAELDYGKVRFVDYLSLLRIGDRWWIVNKVFHKEHQSDA